MRNWIIDMTDEEQRRGVCHIKIGPLIVKEVPYKVAKELVAIHNAEAEVSY